LGVLKNLVLPLTVIVLMLAMFSYLGQQPAQLVLTPEGVSEWGDGYVAEISGELSMTQSEYNIEDNEQPEFPINIQLTVNSEDLYHDTFDDMILKLNGQIRAFTNGIQVYNGYFEELYSGLLLDYESKTLIFTPNEPDSAGVEFSDLTFNVGDEFKVELYSDGHIHGSMWHDDQNGQYYEWDDWSMGWNTAVATWDTKIVGNNGDDPIDTGPGILAGHVQTAGGVAIPGVTVSIASKTGTTDNSGDFTITEIPAGDYSLTASKSGYESYTDDSVRIRANQTKDKTITLMAIGQDDPDPDLDSDGDGFTDVEEIAAGTDPFDPLDFPTDPDELPSFEWNTWVTVLVIIGIVAAILIYLLFKGGFMGMIFAAIALAIMLMIAWLAGAGLLNGG